MSGRRSRANTLTVTLAVLAVTAVGCASKQQGSTQALVTAVEITEGGDELAVPARGITEVDVNSTVELRLSEEAVRAELSEAAAAGADKIPALQRQTRQLRAAIAAQQAALDHIVDRLARPVPGEQVAADMAALATLEQTALDTLLAAVGPAELERILGSGVIVGNHEAIATLQRRVEEIERDIEAISRGLSRVRWRMQATLLTSTGPEPIHLEGYDRVAEGDPTIIDKLALPRDLIATIGNAKAAAKDLADLKTAMVRARDQVGKRAAELRDRLSALGASLGALPELAERIEKAPWATRNQAKALITAVKELRAKLPSLLEPCAEAFEQVRALSSAPPAELTARLVGASSAAERCSSAAKAQAPALLDAGEALAGAIAGFERAIASDAALAAAVGEQGKRDLRALAQQSATRAAGELAAWWASVERMLGRGASVDSPPSFAAPSELTDRAYRELLDTKIDLTRTSRERGDAVYYRAAVVTSGTETAQWSSPPLRVVATGFHIDVSASVVFVRALEARPQDASFPAAPAATAALHYRSERSSGENTGSGLWNFLNPGIGLHVAYLDLGLETDADGATGDDPAMELGVGGTLQLFGDALQGGLAYDLQADRPYFFFGIGLQTLTNFGLTVQ